MDYYNFETNSEIGSEHWFNTLMSQVTRMGEFIESNSNHPLVKTYGKRIKEITKFINKNYKSINKDNIIKPKKVWYTSGQGYWWEKKNKKNER